MLSWIKRLMQKFLEKEKLTDRSSERANINIQYRLSSEGKESDTKKELEARVLYKYPKGQFKFPLIPDSHETHESPTKREKHPDYVPNQNEEKISQPIKPKPKSDGPPVPKRNPVFRPTEIPSPIFAFERPKPADSIEYELTGFIKQDQTSNTMSTRDAEEEKILERSDGNLQEENKLNRVNQKIEPVGFKEAAAAVEEAGAAGTKLDEPEKGTLDYKDGGLFQGINKEGGEAEEYQSVDNMAHKEKQVETHENPEYIKEKNVDAQPQESDTLRSVGETPRKRHVPFNVLMLKQDKRNFEERKMTAKVKQPESSKEEKQSSPILEKKDTNNKEQTKDIQVQEESYQFPPLDLLHPPVRVGTNKEWLFRQEEILNETLKNFNVGAKVVNVTQGPSVTRFEVQPEPGVKVNKITNLSDDIKLSLAAKDIRMEAPIPGKHTIGIEVPNETSRPVLISEIIRTGGFGETASPLAVALGLDISGSPIITDLKKMPHGLIAGATGSGKSVCINTMLVSLLYKAHPDDVKLLLIDPKMVELAPYNHIPHLVSPVITDVKAATASLKWAVEEMERRYELFAHTGVRDIGRFNELAMEHQHYSEKLPYIVIVIDELADLMMMSPQDVEDAICRIAQKARACGIHLIIATQRPSVDVITGLIKANVPTRIAFSVSSQVDSRTIIDISGAEKLLGRGDMLFLENGSSKPFRLQGTFVSDLEIDEIVSFVREQRTPEYLFEQDELIKKSQIVEEEDELFYEACTFIIEQGAASTSSLQRRFKVGYNRAARLIDMMEQNGFISEGRGSKPRDVLISADDLDAFQENNSLH